MSSVPVYTLDKSNLSKLQSILYRYQRFNVTDNDVQLCLNKIKHTIGLFDSLATCLKDYRIIGIGEHKEANYTYRQKDWEEAVKTIREDYKYEDIILEINVGVQIENSKIIPTEETMQILKSVIPQEAFVCLIPNENVRTLYACFALYEQTSLRSSIYTTCDIHSIMVKRKLDDIKDKFGKYCTLIKNVRSAVEHYNYNFYSKFREFTPKELGIIACGFNLSGAGSRYDSHYVRFYPTLKGFRKELIDGILQQMKNRLAADLISEIKSRIKSSLDDSFRNVSFELTSEVAQLFSFIPNLVISVLLVVLRILKDTVLAVVYSVWGVITPINVNDYNWRKEVATEVYEKLSSHDDEIVTKVTKKLDYILSDFQDEIKILEETTEKLKQLKIVDDTSQPTTHAQFREWKYTEKEAHAIGRVVKNFDDKSLIFFGKRYGKSTIAVRCSKGRPEDIASVKQKFPHADIKLIKEATEESRVIDKYIEQRGYLKPEQVAEIRKAIKYPSRALFRKHSNLNMISVSPVKGEGFTSGDWRWIPKEQVCIVLFCSCKGVIPFEEEEFPSKLLEYHVDVREGYMFGCYSKEYNTELRLGCSIGRESLGLAGSIGPFVYKNGNIGFVTSRHVLFKPGECFSHIKVVQPASGDTMNMLHNRQCGIAEDVKDEIDAVYVRITKRSPNNNSFPLTANGLGEPINILGPIEPSRIMANSTLVKFGRTTNLTRTVCKIPIGAVMLDGKVTFHYPEIEDFGARDGMIGYIIEDFFEIPNIDVSEGNPKLFFSPGDSGSAVLLANEDGNYCVVGMAIASSTSDQTQAHEEPKCYVVPITNILDKLSLKLYNLHHEEMETDNFNEEEMDI